VRGGRRLAFLPLKTEQFFLRILFSAQTRRLSLAQRELALSQRSASDITTGQNKIRMWSREVAAAPADPAVGRAWRHRQPPLLSRCPTRLRRSAIAEPIADGAVARATGATGRAGRAGGAAAGRCGSAAATPSRRIALGAAGAGRAGGEGVRVSGVGRGPLPIGSLRARAAAARLGGSGPPAGGCP